MGLFVNFCAGVHEGILPSTTVPAILLNVPYNAVSNKDIRASLKMLAAARAKYVMLDSGGFQLLDKELKGLRVTTDPTKPLRCNQHEMNLAPLHVIQGAVMIQPQIVTALDLPVLKVSDPEEQRREFERKLLINLRWMKETSRLRSKHCPHIQLFVPVQCYNLNQFGLIEPTLLNLHYDGLSLPTRNLDPAGISLFLLKFYRLGVRKIHLLSVSNFTGIALASYFARHVFDWCSVDATTWRQEAQNGHYLQPSDMSKISVRDEASFNEHISLPCNCTWCARTSFTEIKNLPRPEKTDFLRRHNYYVIQQLGRELYEAAQNFDSFVDHIRARNPRQTRKIENLVAALSIVHNRRGDSMESLRRDLGGGKL